MKKLLCAAAGVALTALAGNAWAELAHGEYRGTLVERQQQIPVTLQITPNPRDRRLGPVVQFRLLGTWACTLDLEFGQDRSQVSIYRIVGANGGRCVQLVTGHVDIRPSGGKFNAELFRKDDESMGKFQLTAAPK